MAHFRRRKDEVKELFAFLTGKIYKGTGLQYQIRKAENELCLLFLDGLVALDNGLVFGIDDFSVHKHAMDSGLRRERNS